MNGPNQQNPQDQQQNMNGPNQQQQNNNNNQLPNNNIPNEQNKPIQSSSNNQPSPSPSKKPEEPKKAPPKKEEPKKEVLDNHPLKNYVAKDLPFPKNFSSIFDPKHIKLARHYEDCDDIDVFCRNGLICKSYRCMTKFESSNAKPFSLKGKDMCEDDDDCSSEKECVMHRCVEDEDEADVNKRNEDKDPSVNLLFAGSIFLNNKAYTSGENPDGTFNYDHFFKYIENDIKKADLAIVNQETVFETEKNFEKKVLNTPSELGDAIARAGFKVVLHGTLYAFSKEERGIKNTLNFWKKYPDIKVLGINDNEEANNNNDYFVFSKNNIKIGLINFYSHGKTLIPEDKQVYVNMIRKKKVSELVKKLSKETDFVIVCMNWGDKKEANPNDNQIKWAKELTKQGAKLIIGHHSAVVNPISHIKSKDKRALVIWNLGQLITDNPKKYSILGAMANITISKADDTAYISEYNLIPTITHKDVGKYYTVFKLSQYPDNLFKMSNLNITNYTRSEVVEKCQKVMGGLADCY